MKKLFKGANAKSFEFSRELRQRQTETEIVMWECLRNRKLGVKFRRQHPILNYIADFYCHEILLIIEIDGEIHNTKEHIEYDLNRDVALKEHNITTLRFTNDDVKNRLTIVLEKINTFINECKLKSPSPLGEGFGERL
ncbi:MAG: endonuclease domain-containing protein [Pedobacter sp.]|nr:MAG: endonuclease domain-containing protein [Pedobacter sp.]